MYICQLAFEEARKQNIFGHSPLTCTHVQANLYQRDSTKDPCHPLKKYELHVVLLNLSKPNTHFLFTKEKEKWIDHFQTRIWKNILHSSQSLTDNTITLYTSVLRKMRTIWSHRINRFMQFIHYAARANVKAQTLLTSCCKLSGIKTK